MSDPVEVQLEVQNLVDGAWYELDIERSHLEDLDNRCGLKTVYK
jgi:hypothetical protein